MQKKTAAIIIIGNEILSGRTKDVNINFICNMMTKKGIQTREVRVVPDDMDLVVEAVNLMRSRYDYVFTTGGIGPTHDDITSECIANAFGRKVELNDDAYQALLDYYGDKDKINDARLKMAKLPENAELIANPVTGAPGFRVDNVYAMAGVPKIMQSMLEAILPNLAGGILIHSISITTSLYESQIAQTLSDIQDNEDNVDIGSYPSFKDGVGKVSVVLRSSDKPLLEKLSTTLQGKLKSLGGQILNVEEL